MIFYSVGTNFDSKLIERINELNTKYSDSQVVEVYGSLPKSSVGSGRVSESLPQITQSDLEKHINLVHSYGLRFNYLMNASCEQLSRCEIYGNFMEEIRALCDLGIDAVTLADDVLIKFVRETFPDLGVNVSLIKGVENIEDAKRYSDMGIRSISLNQHTVNRDARTIENIVKSVECEVKLYANISCLNHCPARKDHYDYVSARSRLNVGELGCKNDPFLVGCIVHYLENPIELLKSPFIRPEDVERYVDLGVSHFKLSDRREPTDALMNLVESYMSGKLSPVFEGNLFTMLFREGRKWTQLFDAEEMKGVTLPDIYIDNDVLSWKGFGENVLALHGNELEEYYDNLTGLAVGGLDNKSLFNSIS